MASSNLRMRLTTVKLSKCFKIRFSKSLRPVKLKRAKRNEAFQTMLAPDGTELPRSYYARSNTTKPLTCGASDASFTKYSTLFQHNNNFRKVNLNWIEFCFQELRLFHSHLCARREKKQIEWIRRMIKWPLSSIDWALNPSRISPSYLKIRLLTSLTTFKRRSSQKS